MKTLPLTPFIPIVFISWTTSLLLCLATTQLATADTKKWTADSYKQLEEGSVNGTLITSAGEITTGWETARVTIPHVASVWSMIQDKGLVYVGTDNKGWIYTSRAAKKTKKKRAKKNKAKKWVQIPKVFAVSALATTQTGDIIAGTMPKGEVWRISKAGTKKKIATLKDVETIWSLAVALDGTIYAGTGPKGKLFAISPKANSKPKMVFSTKDKRIMSLDVATDGTVWIGTSSNALVFRYYPKTKKYRAMADFAGNEIAAIQAVGQGAILVANDITSPRKAGPRSKQVIDKSKGAKNAGIVAKKPKIGSVPGADKPPNFSEFVPRKGARKGSGTLYRIEPSGQVTQLHALTATYFTSLVLGSNNTAFAGTATGGKIYTVDTNNNIATAMDVEDRMIAELTYGDAGLVFATVDGVGLYFARDYATKKPTYTSKVWDAKSIAQYGQLVWHGYGKVTVQTRTGNTEDPKLGWYPWKKLYKPMRKGGQNTHGNIVSPAGRYLQWRVLLGNKESVFRKATVYYAPANRPTSIKKITTQTSSRKSRFTLDKKIEPRKPIVKVEWDKDNPDKDPTEYVVYARAEGAVLWQKLSQAVAPLTKTTFDWNTETFSDGHYQIKITTNDSAANPSPYDQTHQKISELFLVDNERPILSRLQIQRTKTATTLSLRASDSSGIIREAAYTTGDGMWHPMRAKDGIFDESSEVVTASLPEQGMRHKYTITVRVADDSGNLKAVSREVSTP